MISKVVSFAVFSYLYCNYGYHLIEPENSSTIINFIYLKVTSIGQILSISIGYAILVIYFYFSKTILKGVLNC